jgi:NitT/TauT family transport system ATP-binding protein
MSETISAIASVGDPRPGLHVEVDHLYLGYPGKSRGEPVIACHDLSFTIGHGEFVVLVGPSGCGKTTFLEALAGLGHVGAGELRIDGKPVTGPGRDRSLVFQAPSLFPWRDVYGNVIFGVQAQGRLDEAAKQRARAPAPSSVARTWSTSRSPRAPTTSSCG